MPLVRSTTLAHAVVSAHRNANADATSAIDGRSRPARSATVNDNRSTLSYPRPVNRPVRTDRSSNSACPSSGVHIRRTTGPGTCAVHRHGVSRHRYAARSRAASTRCATTALDSPCPTADVRIDGGSAGRSIRISTRSINGPDNLLK